jgi:hypothetical protein
MNSGMVTVEVNMTKKQELLPPPKNDLNFNHENSLRDSSNILYNELSLLIEKSRQKAISQVKSALNNLFWQIGKRINDEILHNKRAEYGAHVISVLAARLSADYGRNFELRNLRRMMQFAEQIPDKKIVSTLSTQLSWSHIIELLPLQPLEAKLFYANEAILQGLGVRELRKSIAARKLLEDK